MGCRPNKGTDEYVQRDRYGLWISGNWFFPTFNPRVHKIKFHRVYGIIIVVILGKDLKCSRAVWVEIWMSCRETRPGNSKFLTWLCLMVSAVPRAVALWTLSKPLKSAIIFPTADVKRLCYLVPQRAHFRAVEIRLGKWVRRDLCAREVCTYSGHPSHATWIQKLLWSFIIWTLESPKCHLYFTLLNMEIMSKVNVKGL